jgi:hypothetical protein
MRIPKALSYSSLSLYEKNPDEFYVRHLADHTASKLPQEKPMAVGSSFDAYTKAALHATLYGAGSDPRFAFQTIFESQVEPQNRDFALAAGRHVFESYILSGAYGDLLKLLQQSVEKVRFEFKLDGTINGVPFTGKPDCRFVLDFGTGLIHCILDWKVRGYCSKYAQSPSKGYMLCRDGFTAAKPSRSHGKAHDLFLAYDHKGLSINSGYMEFCNDEYADQLCLYGWLLGEKPGDENVVGMVEEIVAKPTESQPQLRVANHRGRIKADYQQKLVNRVTACWQAITTGYVFPLLSREDSDAHIAVLDEMAVGLMSSGTPLDDWFNSVTRPTLW